MNPADITKNNRKTLKIFVVFFACLFLWTSLYFLKDSILNIFKHKVPIDQELNSDVEEVATSPFSDLIQKEDEGIVYTKSQMSNLDTALKFYTKLKSNDENWESILEEGQVLAEVTASQDGDKTYKLVYSKNPSLNLKYTVGDTLNFKPTLANTDSLTLMQGRSVKFAMGSEYTDNFEEDALHIGDKFAFICQEDGCENGVFDWVFVLKNIN